MLHRQQKNGSPRFLKVGQVCVQSKYIVLLQHNGLTSFGSVFQFDGGERLDKPGLGRWRERLRVGLRDLSGDSHTFYLKRYKRPPLAQQVRRIVTGRPRDSTAGREWRTITRLAAAGIPVPPQVAFGQKMRGWFENSSFLVLEAVGGRSLEAWLPRHWQRDAAGAAWRRQQALIEGLARQVAAFHAAGFVHRDLYASHIFLRDEEGDSDSPARFAFIDLQRVFRPRWRRTRWVVKDLAALSFSTERFASRADRLRFWRQYVQAIGRSRWMNTLSARVEAKTRRMRRHQQRRAVGRMPTS